MVKVRFEKKEYEALKRFEKLHHPTIWSWIVEKVNEKGGDGAVRVLDISDEASIFSLMLAEQFPSCSVTCALRGAEMPNIDIPSNVTVINFQSYDDLSTAGDFDVILMKELTQEVGELGVVLSQLRKLFKGSDGKIILLTRPKNPALPLPEVCMPLWRKLAFSREEVQAAAAQAEMSCVCFSASVPCSVPKFEWESILFTGCFPVVKNNAKCTEEVITNFCKSQSPKIAFEEKITMFLLKTQ